MGGAPTNSDPESNGGLVFGRCGIGGGSSSLAIFGGGGAGGSVNRNGEIGSSVSWVDSNESTLGGGGGPSLPKFNASARGRGGAGIEGGGKSKL